MINYMKADLVRIARRIPRWILVAVMLAVIVVAVIPGANPATGAETARLFEDFMRYIPVIIGFIEILFVFSDDFHGKTAQIAIGIGVSRHNVVMAKWLETVILAIADTLLCLLAAWLTVNWTSSRFPAELAGEIAISCVMCVVTCASCITIVMPILFLAQGTTVSLLLYVFLSAGWLCKAVDLLGSIKEIAFLHISNFTLTHCLNVFRTRWVLGSFQPWVFIGILVYTCGFLALTITLYRKQELEF